MHSLTERLLSHIRRDELLHTGDRVGVAVSGGIDSVALLRLLLEVSSELGIVLSAVHFNHNLRGSESDADQQFVESLAREHGLEFYCASGNVKQHAVQEHSGIEAAARELRYDFFGLLLGAADATSFQDLSSNAIEAATFQNRPQNAVLDKIATGHTLDDQAETVLMRLIRGTGMRGLGGIHPRILVEDEEHDGEIVRPLLAVRRCELENYLNEIRQPWREDSTNTEAKFTRNRVRKLVLPLLEREFNPSVAENFAELAEIAREEEDYWENEISGWLGTVVQWSQPEWAKGLPGFGDSKPLLQTELVQIQAQLQPPPDAELLSHLEEAGPAMMNASISRPWLLTEPRAVQRRVLKAIGEHAGLPLEFKHIEDILRFAGEDGPSGKELSLPLGWKLLRESEAIVFVTPDPLWQERVPDYEYSLPVPGRAAIPELGVVIEALLLHSEQQIAEYNRQQLIRPDLLPAGLRVRNWRAGDRFWPAHTKGPKKVKELLQERRVAQPERRLWPVVLSGNAIVWMRGFPVPAQFHTDTNEALVIRETAEESTI